MLNLIDKKIRQAFSDAALHYDVLTSLQKEIGRDLLARLRSIENGLFIDEGEKQINILDVGMGTGWLTKRLKNFFVDAQVYGLDFAPGMIDVAKPRPEGIKIVEANACELPFEKEYFDLVVSNLAYQWIGNLPRAFEEVFRTLKPKGYFYFTLFGGATCQELFDSLEKTSEKSFSQGLPIDRLATLEAVREALKESGFQNPRLQQERIKVRFPDMLSLVKWLKDTGANALDREFFIGKEWLTRANDHYNQTFCDHLGVFSTFEVIWVEASK